MSDTKVTITIDEKTHQNKVLFKIEYGNQLLEFGIPKEYINNEDFNITEYVNEIIKGK